MSKRVLIGLCLILSGCGLHVRPVLPDAHYLACQRYGYCGPNAGAYQVGSTRCFTNNMRVPNPIDNKDSRCE